MTGCVYLVGAGPGDPDLLTVKAFRLLQKAEVVVYDRLVNKAVMDLVPSTAERIYAGKRKHLHTLSQTRINQLLIDKALEGKQVVRLKGGDPYIFGRGAEELDALTNAGITCEVVPGITAAQGAAASAGLPLTHRESNQAVTYITAHRVAGLLDVNWSLMLHPRQAVVVYMGLTVVEELVNGLLARGKSGNTPFSVISKATLPDEVVVHATLGSIMTQPGLCDMASPAILLLGIPHHASISHLHPLQQAPSHDVLRM